MLLEIHINISRFQFFFPHGLVLFQEGATKPESGVLVIRYTLDLQLYTFLSSYLVIFL